MIEEGDYHDVYDLIEWWYVKSFCFYSMYRGPSYLHPSQINESVKM